MTETKEKRKPGRPKGTPQPTKWGEPTITKTHRMTPKAHQWVKEHKEFIEIECRK